VLRLLVRRTENEWDDWLLVGAAGPVRLALSVVAFRLLAFLLALPAASEAFVEIVCQALAVVSVTWLLLRCIDVLARVVHAGMAKDNAGAADTLIPMGRRFTKLIVLAVALISLIHNLGFNAAGLLTGLGVGGLAVALAAQKTLENLFGGISVIADKPVEVGQFCKVGEHLGTVEEIGLRSTQLRTLDRTVVTIPNAEFSTVRIENYARRDKMRLFTVLQVGYDTTPDQMRWLLAELRKLLFSHPRTLSDQCRVRFVNFGAHSLDIEVFVYVDTKEWVEFLKVREDIFLRVIDVVAASGAYFAYPSQTLYLGRDGGRDREKSAEAEAAVKRWREACSLPFPDFSADALAGFEGTLDYPPEGSETPREPAASA
jgi:MscS family membrane protein